MWKRKVRHILGLQLDRARESEPQSSMRDLARRLELSSGALSELLSGKRRLSQNIARKLVGKMILTDEERAEIDQLMEPRPTFDENLEVQEIAELITNWIYFAIFALLDLDHPPLTADAIRDRLHLSDTETRDALERMTELGLIEFTGERGYRPRVSVTSSLPRLSGQEMRGSYERNFRLALSVLGTLTPNDHDFSTITFAGNHEQMEAARSEIRRLRERLPVVMNSGALGEIYQLNVQLFPLKNWHALEEKAHANAAKQLGDTNASADLRQPGREKD